jgi:hypothetical protein
MAPRKRGSCKNPIVTVAVVVAVIEIALCILLKPIFGDALAEPSYATTLFSITAMVTIAEGDKDYRGGNVAPSCHVPLMRTSFG